ncbi:glycosyl transferase family 2 [Pseudofrankia sp. EUN1h]|nr:glycosyl transferase family 2 [Pseudofrankia sp. EUN1h]
MAVAGRKPARPVAKHARRNLTVRDAYTRCAEVCGPLTAARGESPQVEFRSVVPPGRRFALTLLFTFTTLVDLLLIGWLLLPDHVPGPGVIGIGDWRLTLARVSFCLVILVEVIRLVQVTVIWILAWNAKDPVPLTPPSGLRVAVLTTIVPSKEPISVVAKTLRAMREISYPDGFLTPWILDEEDDPEVRRIADELGVLHFSRKGRPEYNQPDGEFRARSKAGNHNAWRAEHESGYDVVAQMDPDHVPLTCFLERTLGYFRDPDVAFVVAPQVYGNMRENWVARGASMQQYLFNGVIERGGNGLDAPLLIGTNHLYRPDAWRQIGGYQDSIIEDHLTSMRVQGTVNPATGNPWKGVYTPDVIAIGEGPTTWTDYFNQQKRWAYGVWDVKLRRRARAGIRLRARQRLVYGMVQFYYPSVAMSLLFGSLATIAYLIFGATAISLPGDPWLTLWSASLASWLSVWLWLRRFNLADHERREAGMAGMALTLFAGPIYVSAAFAALLRRPLAYAVTAKGELRSSESLRTFRLHLGWAISAGALLGVNLTVHRHYATPQAWALLSLVVGMSPPLIAVAGRIAARGGDGTTGDLPSAAARIPAPAASDRVENQLRLAPRLAEQTLAEQTPGKEGAR